MRKIRIIFVLLAVMFITITCKKEHVAPINNGTPAFYFNGTIGGITTTIPGSANISIAAGINNYYMYSSYIQDSNHVYNFIADLKQTNSNLNSIQIQINDYKASPVGSNTQPDSSFKTGSYSYYSVGLIDTTYDVQFSSSYVNGTPQTYTWTFGDGTTSNAANPVHNYANMATYNVCLTIAGSSGSNTICNKVNLSSPTIAAKQSTITTSSFSNTINFNATSAGFSPSKYVWNFGDASTDSVITTSALVDSLSHVYSTPGLYSISLTVKDAAGGDSLVTNYNAATATYTACATNYKITNVSPVITSGSLLRLSNVVIKWTDASGMVYISNSTSQQLNPFSFKIISEEPYQNNLNGQFTRKLHVAFTCTLYSSAGDSVQINNADAIIAVAYK